MRKGKEDILHIVGVKTNKGYYITDNYTNDSYFNSSLKYYFVNGKKLTSSFKKDWFFIGEEPKTVEIQQSQPNINYRYELIDKSLESEKFPLIFQRNEVAYYDDDEGYWEWKKEYQHFESLYTLKYDKQPNIMVSIDFDFTVLMELQIDDIKQPISFAYPVKRTQWDSDGLIDITNDDVKHQLIDKIMFPPILLHEMPSKLSSEQVYKIVRQHIKQYINYEVAEITSDYDFCFTVKKKIALDDPYTSQWEITKSNGKSYSPPRYNKRYVSARSVEIFEMTYSPYNYKGYTPISEIIANNEEELKEKVDKLCEDLIKMINEPLIDCPHCKGMGVILKDTK